MEGETLGILLLLFESLIHEDERNLIDRNVDELRNVNDVPIALKH